VDNFDIIIAISALELALKIIGANIDFGKGVAAAQEILLEVYLRSTIASDRSMYASVTLVSKGRCPLSKNIVMPFIIVY
jgi:hypothetical protein